jgi:hypothetical protein
MARDSYLGQIARRAVLDAPGLLPPRRIERALPVTPLDKPASTVHMPAAKSSHMPVVDHAPPRAPTRVDAPPSASVELETRPELAASAVNETSPMATRSGVVSSVIPVAASPTRDAAPQLRPADREQQPPGGESLAATTTAPGVEPVATVPIEPRRPMAPRRNIAVAPDPLAIALATAVRWTSSDDERAGSKPAAPAKRPAMESAGRSEPSMAVLPETHRRERLAPPGDVPPRVPPGPRVQAIAGTPDDRSAPTPAGDRIARVHIGSGEVQILTPPGARPPVSSAPVPAPLARGLTSAIGLRQS